MVVGQQCGCVGQVLPLPIGFRFIYLHEFWYIDPCQLFHVNWFTYPGVFYDCRWTNPECGVSPHPPPTPNPTPPPAVGFWFVYMHVNPISRFLMRGEWGKPPPPPPPQRIAMAAGCDWFCTVCFRTSKTPAARFIKLSYNWFWGLIISYKFCQCIQVCIMPCISAYNRKVEEEGMILNAASPPPPPPPRVPIHVICILSNPIWRFLAIPMHIHVRPPAFVSQFGVRGASLPPPPPPAHPHIGVWSI